MLSVSDDARPDGTGHDDATGSAPEATLEAYAQRDPRAGQGITEHKIGLTFLAAATPGKCSRVAFTLPGIAEVIGGPNRECTDSSLFRFAYQLVGAGQKPASGVSHLGKAATRAFLLTRLGALAWFEPERREEAESSE